MGSSTLRGEEGSVIAFHVLEYSCCFLIIIILSCFLQEIALPL